MPGGILGGAASGASAGMVAGPYGAIAGAVIGGVLGALSYHPPEPPKLSKVSLDPATTGQKDFLDQSEHIGDVGKIVQQANDYSNDAYQENVAKFAPQTKDTIGRIGATGAALASGNLPAGFLTPGPNGRALTAADLNMTSDDLVKTGAGVVGQGENQAQALNPFNSTSTGTLMTPGAFLARRDSSNYYNTGLKNQAAIGQSVGSAIDPFSSGVATGLGALTGNQRGLTNLFGGGATATPGYGFGQGDTGPTADTQFDATGNFIGGADLSGV